MPVAEIVALARARGVDVMVDAAHSWGQVEVTVGSLGADFVGFTLQKWIAGPVGLGAVYIRKGRLAAIDPMMGDEDNPPDSVLSRVHSGTVNFAAALTAPAALDDARRREQGSTASLAPGPMGHGCSRVA